MDFDIVFGPAYKGIPLATGVASAWYSLFGEDKEFAYNRKEPKDHGEVCCPIYVVYSFMLFSYRVEVLLEVMYLGNEC